MQETDGRSAEFVRGFNTALTEHSEFIRNNSAEKMQANMRILLAEEALQYSTGEDGARGRKMLPRVEGGGPLADNMRKLLADPSTSAGSAG